jgi:hypothetical protein
VQLPGDQLDGSLAVLLPALEQLHTSTGQKDDPSLPYIQLVLRALCGHPSMQRLSHTAYSSAAALWPCWVQELPWRSLPTLHALKLSGVRAQLLGALLEDVSSGCCQLQELEVSVDSTHAAGAPAGSSLAHGLAALAGAHCRHSLRSVNIDLYGGNATPQLLPTPAQVAPLLLRGMLPQLQELQLPIMVRAGSLLQGDSGAGRAWRASHEAPPGGPEQYLQLLVGGLEEAGVQGLGGFRLTGGINVKREGSTAANVCWARYEGCAGRCQLSGQLWMVW